MLLLIYVDRNSCFVRSASCECPHLIRANHIFYVNYNIKFFLYVLSCWIRYFSFFHFFCPPPPSVDSLFSWTRMNCCFSLFSSVSLLSHLLARFLIIVYTCNYVFRRGNREKEKNVIAWWWQWWFFKSYMCVCVWVVTKMSMSPYYSQIITRPICQIFNWRMFEFMIQHAHSYRQSKQKKP